MTAFPIGLLPLYFMHIRKKAETYAFDGILMNILVISSLAFYYILEKYVGIDDMKVVVIATAGWWIFAATVLYFSYLRKK